MVRRLLMATLVVVSLACMVQDAHASSGHCRRGRVVNYLFGGYGPGPFGKGYVEYAGQRPIYNYTTCGHIIQ